MKETVLSVEGMSCEHCVKAVNNAVGALPGVGSVTVDLAGKRVTVEHDDSRCTREDIKAAIEDQGYDIID